MHVRGIMKADKHDTPTRTLLFPPFFLSLPIKKYVLQKKEKRKKAENRKKKKNKKTKKRVSCIHSIKHPFHHPHLATKFKLCVRVSVCVNGKLAHLIYNSSKLFVHLWLQLQCACYGTMA